MKKRAILLFISLIFTFNLSAQLENIPLLTVTGEGVIKTQPNQIILEVKVNKVLNIDELNNLGSLNEFLSAEIKLKTTINDDDEFIISLFKIVNTQNKLIFVRDFYITTNTDKYAGIIIQLLRLGYSQISLVDFRLKDPSAYKQQALIKAIEAAKNKAQLIAKEIGQDIGSVHSLEEIQTPQYSWYANPNDIDSVLYIKNITDYNLVEPGYITVPAKVKVSFDLIK